MCTTSKPSRAPQLVQLVAVDHVLVVCATSRASRVGVRSPRRRRAPHHRHQRHDARAAGDQQQRPLVARLPDEVAADRAAHLEHSPSHHHVDEVRRDLAVLEPLDRDRKRLARRRGDRVAPLAPGSRPPRSAARRGAGRRDGPATRARRASSVRTRGVSVARRGDLGHEPGQSPQYRCSSHGSPRRW